MNYNLFNPKKHILLNKRILLKIPTISNKTEGGIYLSGETEQREQNSIIKGELVSWADGAFDDFKIKPKKGDYIFFEPYAGRILFDENEVRYRHFEPKEITGFEPKE